MSNGTLDVIGLDEVGSLFELFRERVRRTPQATAYRYFDAQQHGWRDISWQQASQQVAAIQAALAKEGLQAGDRVALMLRNCPQWVLFEQAALGLGLVLVPLYTNDRAENVAYVLQDAGVRLLLLEGENALNQLDSISPQLQGLVRLITVDQCDAMDAYPRLVSLAGWADSKAAELQSVSAKKDQLASLVYTSGTTGLPKGVMLSHGNILFNADAAMQAFPIYREDVFLSFLPLSHMLERTLGEYIPMMCGSTVAFARSVQDLAEDLLSQQPTVLVSVPRIYERVYNKIHTQLAAKSPLAQRLFHRAVETGWRRFKNNGGGGLAWPVLKALVASKIMAKLGGRLRLAICGGAPLSEEVAKTFIGLGLNLVQGYGLTETSPIISGNRIDNNDPASVGEPLPGIEIKIGDDDELLTRSPSVMLGYWQNREATEAMIDSDGWLHTGDKVRVENNRIYITGRLKEIIVLSNGEKVPPADMELAIMLDPLLEQALVIGESLPFLSVLVVLEPGLWKAEASKLGLDAKDPAALEDKKAVQWVKERIAERLKGFPGYAVVRAVALQVSPWSIEEGTMTPTMKLRRKVIIANNAERIDRLYRGH
jgi:long-chain acyl-CoA synthetase